MNGKKTYTFVALFLLNALLDGVMEAYPEQTASAVGVVTGSGAVASLRHAIAKLLDKLGG